MLKIYNSLTRRIEEFKPFNPPTVTMYTCGPTVYDFAHIGNFRTYTTSDLLLRNLVYNGFQTKYVMNITDVGHLTNDTSGGADTGEDKLEKSAKKEGKTAWEIAQFYTNAFLSDFKSLNLIEPEKFCKATEHIKEQISLIEILEKKKFTYATSDGVYFDTGKFKDYGKLSDLDEIKEGARVEVNEEKRNPRDFALWKFSPSTSSLQSGGQAGKVQRHMEWESPWGVGFPGWHIECSAMSMKYLGETIDIHAGGMDLKQIHHQNEIAQSEAVTGKRFVNFWVHSAFVLVANEKMSKSLGNIYRVYDLEKKGYDPLALRYLYMQTHYRQEMNFTFAGLDGAAHALQNLREKIVMCEDYGSNSGAKEYEDRFLDAVNDDLNMPQALAVVWELIKSDEANSAKLKSLLKFDEVLGLDLADTRKEQLKKSVISVPDEVRKMVEEREDFRKNRQYTKADHLRNKIKKLGYDVLDTEKGSVIKKAD